MDFTQEQKLYLEIVHKAWEDDQFKSDLTTDPVAAIEKLTGQKLNLPQGKTLVVRDQTDNASVYINLPAKPNTEDIELNEEQLEVVSGGAKVSVVGPIINILVPPLTTFPINPTDFS